jgi:hypothetical protein
VTWRFFFFLSLPSQLSDPAPDSCGRRNLLLAAAQFVEAVPHTNIRRLDCRSSVRCSEGSELPQSGLLRSVGRIGSKSRGGEAVSGQRSDDFASEPVEAAEALAGEDAEAAAELEVELAPEVFAAGELTAGFGAVEGAGADVAGAPPPAGEPEQQEFPCAGAVEQHGGFGAETPAMPDPRPSFCKLVASSFPLGSRPLAD